MDGPLIARADAVRARIAAAVLDDGAEFDAHPAPDRADDERDARLGDVVLLPHQRDAVRRLRASLARVGGALLADDVGLGKTFVALALARDAAHALVIEPAALRGMWLDAMRRARVAAPVVSIESLGRARPPTALAAPGRRAPSLVIVDEAHHARNRATRRWAALADLCADARVLLLTATPVHNRDADLRALLALFLGARASHVDDAALARCVVRRRAADARDHTRDHARDHAHDARAAGGDAMATPPRVLPVRALHVAQDDATLARLLALPAPVPAADGGVASALATMGLVRQWASSVAALRVALRRRLGRTVALAAAVRAGRRLTAADLRRAVVDDDAVQLAFPELLAMPAADAPALLRALDAHDAALRTLLHELDDSADDARARALREVRAAHPGARIVAFTTYAATATSLYRRLRADGGACVLHARGATVAGGRLTRREALHRFAPLAHGRPPPPAADAVTLLLATDVLSEGIGLQDAAVVVHLDLPWTPARLAQRVGRAARLGSPHREIAVYALMPPAGADAWLGAERRLRAKLGAAARLVGGIGAVLPAGASGCRTGDNESATGDRDAARAPAPGEAMEAVRATLRRWLAASADGATPLASRADVTLAAAVVAAPAHRGALLALVGPPWRLVARAHAGYPVSDAPATVLAAVHLLSPRDEASVMRDDDRARNLIARDAAADPAARGEIAAAVEAVDAWRASAAADGALGARVDDRMRRRLLRRVARAAGAAPRGERAAAAALAALAREAAAAPCGAGTERRLARLLDVDDDATLLRAAADVGARIGARAPDDDPAPALRALLVACAP